jgi:hypothetical protein
MTIMKNIKWNIYTKVSFINSFDFCSSNKGHFKIVFSLIYSVLSTGKWMKIILKLFVYHEKILVLLICC